MPRNRGDGSHREAVISPQQNRQPLLAQLAINGTINRAVPSRDLGQISITADARATWIRRTIEVTAIPHLEAALRERRVQPGHAQRLRAHGGSAIARPDIGGRTDKARLRARRAHAKLPWRTRGRAAAN